MLRKACLLVGIVVVVIALSHQAVQAKSCYVVGHHSYERFQAWDIQPNGTLVFQLQRNLSSTNDPAGIGIYDEAGNEYMFVSGEFASGLEIWNPVTHTHVGHEYSGGQMGGVDVHTANKKVYAVGRQTNRLHTWDFNSTTGALTYQGFQTLGGTRSAFSLCLDETNDILWVADYQANQVQAYSTSNFAAPISSFAPGNNHTPIDIAVDSVRGKVYTVGGWAWDSTLSVYDIATGTETQYDLMNVRSNLYGLGIAVDETTGYVYMTTGASQGSGYHEILVMDPTTFAVIQETNYLIGSPGGLAIGNVSYNPLDLQKTGPGWAATGTLFGFTIGLDSGTIDYTNATLTDTLAPEMVFSSATGGGVYDPVTHTVTWNLGTIQASDPSMSFGLTVGWGSGAAAGMTYTNFATLTADNLSITRTADVVCAPYIPEPVTVVSFLLGLGLLGGIARRRRNRR